MVNKTPTRETLHATFLNRSIEQGYRALRDQGYDISRSKCAAFRNRMRSEGIVQDPRDVWTDERIAKVRDLAARGYNSKTIARELDTTRLSILAVCSSRKISLRKGNAVQIPTREQVDELYQNNSMVIAARKMGVADTTFRRWVRYYGLTRPEPVKPAPAPVIAKPSTPKLAVFRRTEIPAPECGPAANAARYLRQQGYTNVYRRGPQEWWVGRGPMAEVDMIARAEEIEARKERLRA